MRLGKSWYLETSPCEPLCKGRAYHLQDPQDLPITLCAGAEHALGVEHTFRQVQCAAVLHKWVLHGEGCGVTTAWRRHAHMARLAHAVDMFSCDRSRSCTASERCCCKLPLLRRLWGHGVAADHHELCGLNE